MNRTAVSNFANYFNCLNWDFMQLTHFTSYDVSIAEYGVFIQYSGTWFLLLHKTFCIESNMQTVECFECDCAACRDDQFECPNSGLCIRDYWVCDGWNDCGDMSDEQNCSE